MINYQSTYFSKRFILQLLILLLLLSCYRERKDDRLFVDYDRQKIVNKELIYIVYDSLAHSGNYVGYCDSTSKYSSGLRSNLAQLFSNKRVSKVRISAYVKKFFKNDDAALVFKILDKDEGELFLNVNTADIDKISKIGEWTKIEYEFELPIGQKLYNPDNLVYVFLFSPKYRMHIDDLEISGN